MTGVPQAIASTTLKPNGSSKLIEVQQRPRAAEQAAATVGPDRADVAHPLPVESRLHELLEVAAVLDDPGDHERHARALGDIDRLHGPLVRMDPTEEQEVVARRPLKLELAQVDAVVDRGDVVETLVPVRIADRDVVAAPVVLLEDGNDLLRREPVNRRHDRGVDQAAVGQRQEVETVVDHVELARAFEDRRDVQRLPDLRIQCRILGVAGRRRADEASGRDGVGRGEQGDVDSSPDQALGQQRSELLPRAVMARRYPPRDRCQNRDPHGPHHVGRGLTCDTRARG